MTVGVPEVIVNVPVLVKSVSEVPVRVIVAADDVQSSVPPVPRTRRPVERL